MPSDLLAQIESMIAQFRQKLQEMGPRLDGVKEATGDLGFRDLELAIHAEARALADGITEAVLQTRVKDTKFEEETSRAARQALGMRGGGRPTVKVTLLGGRVVRLKTAYLKQDRRGKRLSDRATARACTLCSRRWGSGSVRLLRSRGRSHARWPIATRSARGARRWTDATPTWGTRRPCVL